MCEKVMRRNPFFLFIAKTPLDTSARFIFITGGMRRAEVLHAFVQDGVSIGQLCAAGERLFAALLACEDAAIHRGWLHLLSLLRQPAVYKRGAAPADLEPRACAQDACPQKSLRRKALRPRAS